MGGDGRLSDFCVEAGAARFGEAVGTARRRLAASPWPAMLARGAEPPGTPAIGGDARLAGFGVEAGSAGFAVGPAVMLARGAELPGLPAIGGDGRLGGFGGEAGSAGFAGWLYAMARSVAD